MPKKQTYEEAIDKLEIIISQLENTDTPLENAIQLYKTGIELATFCNEKLVAIEGQVAILKKESDGIFKKKNWSNTD